MPEAKKITIYTDGACSGNPGPGGWGIIVVSGTGRQEKSGGFARTTNNRMEIMAAVAALESLQGDCRVTLYSDSEYLVKAMKEGWARRWQENRWMRNKKDKALNPDLWERLLNLCRIHQVDFVWVKGHDSHPENERCDALARAALGKPGLPADPGYAKTAPRPEFKMF